MTLIRTTILILGVGIPVAVVAGPAVKIPNDTFNVGKVIQNATTTHSFWIKSVGDDTLRIIEVVPGCGCTQMPLTDSVLAPGDSTRLDIIFSTKSFVGNVQKHPYLQVNTPAERVGVTIQSEILVQPETATPLIVQPWRVDVSQFTVQPRRRSVFQIVNKSDRELELRVADTAFKSFSVQLPTRIAPSATAQGVVIVNKDRIKTAFKESFTFRVRGGGTSDFYTVPVERLYRIKDSAAAVGAKRKASIPPHLFLVCVNAESALIAPHV
ncbi:MAG: DUF1573 domain-containing protein [candidate division Zixibacteria bacterium]|nr:DUF1573 domain-containing protein [candidate division Zixibacteria bacterium]